MSLTKKEIKQRYFDKVYENALLVPCACGCGVLTKNKDKYGRDRKFINGHDGRKYDNPTQYKREWNHRNRSARYIYKRKLIHLFKKELILQAGGKCTLCGIPFEEECTAVFDFHHITPKEKRFNVNNAALNKYSKKEIRKEVKKCELVCANCHRLIHWDWNWNFINTADSQ